MTAAAPPATVRELAAFWREGGLRVFEPLAERGRGARGLAILVQPDGDLVMSVPRDFGADPDDLAASRALIGRAGDEVRRIAGDGFELLARRIVRAGDVGTGVIVAGGWVLAGLQATLAPLILSAAVTTVVGGGRWVVRRKLPSLAGWIASRWLRGQIRQSHPTAGGRA